MYDEDKTKFLCAKYLIGSYFIWVHKGHMLLIVKIALYKTTFVERLDMLTSKVIHCSSKREQKLNRVAQRFIKP